MDNASKNASDMIGSLQMQYNRGRQAAITNELVDIITGIYFSFVIFSLVLTYHQVRVRSDLCSGLVMVVVHSRKVSYAVYTKFRNRSIFSLQWLK